MELLVFAGLALVAAVAGLLVIVQRHAVYSALFLIITMGSLAGIYILLDAHFVWVIQVIVYAGAIMVLFLFVIMLLDIRSEPAPWAPPDRGRILIAVLLSVVLLATKSFWMGLDVQGEYTYGAWSIDRAAVRDNWRNEVALHLCNPLGHHGN